MKRLGITILLVAISARTLAETNKPLVRGLPFVRPSPGMAEVVGGPTNQWLYVWPHDLIPEEFSGFGVVFSPVDRTKKNQGCTMQNWGRAVVLTNTDATMEITCRRDYSMPTSQPWMEDAKPLLHFAPTNFHGAPAGMASQKNEEGDAIIYFVFRRKSVVFDLKAKGRSDESCKVALRAVAEQIWKFGAKESPTPRTGQ
jgi:hypothetical protein